MNIYPCLGLKGGRWVAVHADPGEENQAYPEGPVVKAGELEKLGVKWIQLIDVDGAKMGRPRQMGLMRSVINRVGCKIQVGGAFAPISLSRTASDPGRIGWSWVPGQSPILAG